MRLFCMSLLLLSTVSARSTCSGKPLQANETATVDDTLCLDIPVSFRTSRLATLRAALAITNMTAPSNAYTVFTPVNEAFNSSELLNKTGLTEQQLFQPANREALFQLLSYHIVPVAALNATQLRSGLVLQTALLNATPTVDRFACYEPPNRKWYDFSVNCTGVVNAMSDNVTVLQPFGTGDNYVYVIDKVLVPDSLVNWTRRAAAGHRL